MFNDREMTPLTLYTYQTPNGHKASIMLEETALPYRAQIIDIEKGDQLDPAFLMLNPNNKIPVIVDPDHGRTVFESGAILQYLAERAGVGILVFNEPVSALRLAFVAFIVGGIVGLNLATR